LTGRCFQDATLSPSPKVREFQEVVARSRASCMMLGSPGTRIAVGARPGSLFGSGRAERCPSRHLKRTRLTPVPSVLIVRFSSHRSYYWYYSRVEATVIPIASPTPLRNFLRPGWSTAKRLQGLVSSGPRPEGQDRAGSAVRRDVGLNDACYRFCRVDAVAVLRGRSTRSGSHGSRRGSGAFARNGAGDDESARAAVQARFWLRFANQLLDSMHGAVDGRTHQGGVA
jgi:hypothetical protein